jgi:signal transduction histidine kinase
MPARWNACATTAFAAVRPAALELGTFVPSLADGVLWATERRSPIELSLPVISTEIQANKRLLRHIFINLLTNAVKRSDTDRCGLKWSLTNGKTVYAIRDQGIGIPEADQAWLFNAFHRGLKVGDRPGIVQRTPSISRTGVPLNTSKKALCLISSYCLQSGYH